MFVSEESPPENLEYWLTILMAVVLVAWVISGAFLIVEGITSRRGIGLLSDDFFVAATPSRSAFGWLPVSDLRCRTWLASAVATPRSRLATGGSS